MSPDQTAGPKNVTFKKCTHNYDEDKDFEVIFFKSYFQRNIQNINKQDTKLLGKNEEKG